jgi:hypothetical protein
VTSRDSELTFTDALSLFTTIPDGDPSQPSVDFFDFSHDTRDYLYPPVFDLYGEQVMLQGPIHLVEMQRKNKVRFVEVQFFRADPEKRYTDQFYDSAWGWQGENQIIHLLTHSAFFNRDPLQPDDAILRKLARNARGRDGWDVDG